MPAKGVIVLKQNQHATYVVHSDFNYYVQLSAGSSIEFKSKFGKTININYNIWGPGNIKLSGNATMKASMGVSPNANSLTGLQIFQYHGNNTFTEEIP